MTRTKLTREEILKMRQDPANFRCGKMIYACKADPYVILPKQIKWLGWTVNMAHPDAVKTITGLGLFTAFPVLFVIFYFQNLTAVFVSVVLTSVVMCAWCAHKSKLP